MAVACAIPDKATPIIVVGAVLIQQSGGRAGIFLSALQGSVIG
jgi:hypothetical protein